jgi:hypothetical protein
MRTLLSALFLIVLLAALALVYRGELITRIAPSLLSHAGLHDVSLELSAPELEQTIVKHFTATIVLPSGPAQIQIHDLVCRYHLRGLLSGRIKAVNVAAVDITLPPSPPDDRPSPPMDLTLPDPVAFLQQIETLALPMERLHIHRLRLHQNGVMIASFQTTATATDIGMRLTLFPPDTNPDQSERPILVLETGGGQLGVDLVLDRAAVQEMLPQSLAISLPEGVVKAVLRLTARSDAEQLLHLTVTGVGLSHPQLKAAEAHLQLDLVRNKTEGPLLLAPASTLSIKGARGPDLSMAALAVNLAGQLDLHPDGLHFHLHPAEPWRVDGLAVGTLRLAPLQFADILADIHLDRKQLRVTGSCAAPRGTGTIKIAMTHDLDSEQRGTASLQTDDYLVMTAHNNLLQFLVDPVLPLTLEHGRIHLAAQVAWSRADPLQAQLSFDLVEGQGRLAEVPFTGLAVQQQMRILPHLASIQPGLIRADQLLGPVPMENLHIKASLAPVNRKTHPRVHIEKAEIEIFDGKVATEECLYDFNLAENSCLLTIKEIDLQQIVALQKVEGLTVDGRIGGRLPLVFSSRGVQVDRGLLEHVGQGGIVQYRPPGGAPPGSPLTGYALKALEEFHYQQLAVQVDYIPDGTLTIALHLQGKSPAIDPARAVHLNITTEQNLLSLLQSLQYSQDLPGILNREIRR